jgi:hypothetical protein
MADFGEEVPRYPAILLPGVVLSAIPATAIEVMTGPSMSRRWRYADAVEDLGCAQRGWR